MDSPSHRSVPPAASGQASHYKRESELVESKLVRCSAAQQSAVPTHELGTVLAPLCGCLQLPSLMSIVLITDFGQTGTCLSGCNHANRHLTFSTSSPYRLSRHLGHQKSMHLPHLALVSTVFCLHCADQQQLEQARMTAYVLCATLRRPGAPDGR